MKLYLAIKGQFYLKKPSFVSLNFTFIQGSFLYIQGTMPVIIKLYQTGNSK